MREVKVQDENVLPTFSKDKEGKMAKNTRRKPLSNKTNQQACHGNAPSKKTRKTRGFHVFEEPAELKSGTETADEPVADSSATTRQQSQQQQEQKSQQQESEVDRLVADLCTAEEPSGEYWRQLAESRQCALDEALSENQRLHERLEAARQEISLLRDVVQQAEGVMAAVQEWTDEQEQEPSSGAD